MISASPSVEVWKIEEMRFNSKAMMNKKEPVAWQELENLVSYS
jgi:hypothetical protein